jgi:hypothetical protein
MVYLSSPYTLASIPPSFSRPTLKFHDSKCTRRATCQGQLCAVDIPLHASPAISPAKPHMSHARESALCVTCAVSTLPAAVGLEDMGVSQLRARVVSHCTSRTSPQRGLGRRQLEEEEGCGGFFVANVRPPVLFCLSLLFFFSSPLPVPSSTSSATSTSIPIHCFPANEHGGGD